MRTNMEHDHKFLDGFSPDLYIAILSEVAHSDGLEPEEKAMLDDYASRLGIEPGADMPEIPKDLSSVAWATRIIVYRDAYMMALADGHVSPEEDAHLIDLANKMKLTHDHAGAIRTWTHDYEKLLERLDNLLEAGVEQDG